LFSSGQSAAASSCHLTGWAAFPEEMFCMTHHLSLLLVSGWEHKVSVQIPFGYAVVFNSLHSLEWAVLTYSKQHAVDLLS
jgi:hypothetical protein